jgi:hypothetical protein
MTIRLPLALVLALTIAVPACKDAPEAPRDRTFRAPRPAAPEASSSAAPDAAKDKEPSEEPAVTEDTGPPDEVIEAVLSVLEGIREGKRAPADRAAFESDLVQSMRDNSYCKPNRRSRVAGEIVKTIVDADAKRPLKGVPQERMWRLAEGLARDLSLRCGDDVPRGGTVTALPPFRAPAGHLALKWDKLKGYEFEPGVPLPPEVLALGAKKVAVNGYMIPLSTEARPKEFVIVASLWDCCFGKPPAINHGIIVSFPQGAEYTDFPVLVIGTMEVGEEREDGEVTSVYRLRASQVQAQTL